MLGTVAAELVTPRLVDRVGYGSTFTAGLLLLGAPALALLCPPYLSLMAAVCVATLISINLVISPYRQMAWTCMAGESLTMRLLF